MSLEQLRDNLKGILNHLDPGGRFVYVDYPLHGNIGDLLINQGTEAFFQDYGLNVEQRYCLYDLPEEIPNLDDNVTILLHGGGNFGDIWPRHQLLRERLLKKYTRNRVLILPQTVHFKSKEKEAETCSLMASRDNLHTFVRDTRSYETLTGQGVKNVTMMPDMAHELYGRFTHTPARSAEDTLYFFRKDIESSSIPDRFAPYRRSAVDWSDCIDIYQKLHFALVFGLIKANPSPRFSNGLCTRWYAVRDQIVQSGVDLLLRANSLVTNRLHAMLLGLFLGRTVTAFDNSYGKLSAYYRSWMRDIPELTLIDK